MKKAIILGLSLISSIAIADPVVFGLRIGKTTESELKKLYKVSSTGTNKYSKGNMYSIPLSSIDFEGLQEVITIFDIDGTLAAVLTTLPKDKFNDVNGVLKAKYRLVNQVVPFLGDKFAKYRDGATEISIAAPHMSFDMSVNYIRDDLNKAFIDILPALKDGDSYGAAR
jgi:hypothetical protein